MKPLVKLAVLLFAVTLLLTACTPSESGIVPKPYTATNLEVHFLTQVSSLSYVINSAHGESFGSSSRYEKRSVARLHIKTVVFQKKTSVSGHRTGLRFAFVLK